MRIIQKQLLLGFIYSLFLFIGISLFFLSIIPEFEMRFLLEKRIYDLPVILVLPSAVVICGIVFGFFNAMNVKKQIEMVDEALYQLEQGHINESFPQSEGLEGVYQRIESIQKQMAQQIITTQKLASEKAVDHEKQVQEIVSRERNRLARELHDSVSQQLFAASMLMSAITETKSDQDSPESKQLKLVEDMIQQSQLEMRALLLHLRPVPLKDKSLQEGMQELLGELSQKVPMQVSWKIESVPLEKGVEDHLFRILQESISNTLRHSKASSVEVRLMNRDHLIILRIVDDGVGFNVLEEKAGSYGLQNMYERAKEIGGVMKVVSIKNK